MKKIVVFEFPFQGPFGTEMEAALADLARSIVAEPGFIWKIWTENPAEQVAGGIYVFADQASAVAYIEKHSKRLEDLGVRNISSRMYDMNPGLTDITLGPV